MGGKETMIKQIQQIVQNVLEAKKLTDSAFGIVESVNPIKIKIDNRFTVDESVLTFLSYIEIKYLEVGNRLLLLRVQNGQHFIVQDVLEPRKIMYYSQGVVLSDGRIFVDGKYTIEQSIVEVVSFVGGLQAGDQLVLLRVQNGQRFVVINKV